MIAPVFPFRLQTSPKFFEYKRRVTRKIRGNNALDQHAADFGDDYKLVVVGAVRLPQSSTGKTLADWHAFVDTVKSDYGMFLYAANAQEFSVVTAEALGTSGTVFPLAKRYIDPATLVVKKNGSTLTLTTDYTFAGNETAPIVTLNVAAGGAAITSNYKYYCPMFGEGWDDLEPVVLASKSTDATRNVRLDGVMMVEIKAGGRLIG